jgi:hypothetical protein
MTNLFPVNFADHEKDIKLDYFQEFEIHESLNFLICCFFVDNFPKNCLIAIYERLQLKDADYEYYLITKENNINFKIAELQSLFLSQRFDQNFEIIKNRVIDFLKFKNCKYKIVFAVDLNEEIKNNFKDFYICDLSKNKWWEGLSDYVTTKH